MKKLNIGCGAKKRDGFDGLDIQDFGQKYVGDIFKFMFDNPELEFEEVYAEHFLEHFTQIELKKMFISIWCLLKMGGSFKIIVPSKNKEESWVLTHKTFFTEYTFKAFENQIFAGEFCEEYEWKIKELKTNSRQDIYCELIKI